jgi:hypothetical protein
LYTFLWDCPFKWNALQNWCGQLPFLKVESKNKQRNYWGLQIYQTKQSAGLPILVWLSLKEVKVELFFFYFKTLLSCPLCELFSHKKNIRDNLTAKLANIHWIVFHIHSCSLCITNVISGFIVWLSDLLYEYINWVVRNKTFPCNFISTGMFNPSILLYHTQSP